MPGGPAIQLYKNNTDNKGASYGCHENYLMSRGTPFADIVRHLTPFFVSRQVVCGAGRVGRGADGRDEGFQISQRADFFEVEVGLETTLKRPIINTRDEPHADPDKYRRLHVIIGDANMSEVSTYLKLGTTALVLAMIEDRFLAGDLSVEAPVAELRAVSHDPSCRHLVTLRDGRKMTAVQLQMEYLELARKYTEDKYGTDVDEATADVLTRWESVLSRLADDPMQLLARARLGDQAGDPGGLPDPGRAGLEPPPAAAGRPPVLRRPRPTAACTTGWPPAAGSPGWWTSRTWSGPWSSRPRTPGRSSAAAACSSTRRRSRPPRGIRSSSTFPAASPCSGCRPWSRCAAPGRTSASCWTAAARPRAGRRADRPGLTRRPRRAAAAGDRGSIPMAPGRIGPGVGGRG